MPISERVRRRIYEYFEAVMGPEEAEALTENVMSVHDVATHADLRVLRAELGQDIEKLRGEMHQAIVGQTRWLVGYITAWSGVVLALAKLLL